MLKAFLLYLFIGYINQFVAINMVAPVPDKPLHDIGFKYLPYVDPKICDLSLIILVIYFVLRWIFKDYTKINNFTKMMTWIFVIRVCCFYSTAVPYPNAGCHPRIVGDPIRWNVFPYLYNNHLHSCYDLMFSGHAAHATLIALFTIIYSKHFEQSIF